MEDKTYFTPHEITPGLRRIKLVLEYDGTPYHGWQTQSNPKVPTIQSEIEKAFTALTQTPLKAMAAAGRTDKGVHARAMACHLDTFHPIAPQKIKTGLNRHLPNSIAVVAATEADQHFHARYSCRERQYQYAIINRQSRSPLLENRAAFCPYKLDVNAMKKAAKYLEGQHDFSAFRSSECQGKTPQTTLKKVEVHELDQDIIRVEIAGVTFLHNMVRILVGTLVDVGSGKKTPEDVQTILAQKDRCQAGKTMPAHGLYFTKACY